MSPMIAVYTALIALLVLGIAVAYLRYRADRRGRPPQPGQEHIAEPLPRSHRRSRV